MKISFLSRLEGEIVVGLAHFSGQVSHLTWSPNFPRRRIRQLGLLTGAYERYMLCDVCEPHCRKENKIEKKGDAAV